MSKKKPSSEWRTVKSQRIMGPFLLEVASIDTVTGECEYLVGFARLHGHRLAAGRGNSFEACQLAAEGHVREWLADARDVL